MEEVAQVLVNRRLHLATPNVLRTGPSYIRFRLPTRLPIGPLDQTPALRSILPGERQILLCQRVNQKVREEEVDLRL